MNDKDALMTVTEAAELLRVSPGTLYHWISEGRGMPVVRLSARCVRFQKSALQEWLKGKVVAREMAELRHVRSRK